LLILVPYGHDNQRLKGKGNWGQLAFCLSAVVAPYGLLSVLVALPSLLGSGMQFVGICINLGLVLIGIYAFVLNINAIKAVEGFTTGRAIGVFVYLFLILLAVSACATITLALLGPALSR